MTIRSHRRRANAVIAALGCLALSAATLSVAEAGDTKFDPTKTVVLPAEQVVFEAINPAINMGEAWGNRGAGAHGTFGQFPADFITPFHTHSGAYHGIVLQGVMTNPFEGEKSPPRMAAGSYWYVPANAIHATACVSATPCAFYFHAGQAFDFKPVK